jgi:hypothetical protein
MNTIEIPREKLTKRGNPEITILTENLCLAMFDHETEGKSYHISDIAAAVFQQITRAYPEIKTRAQCEIYVLWAMKTLCWNNRAKLVEQDWFENPYTASEQINDSLTVGAPWENRIPGKFGKQTSEQKRVWRKSLDMATWAVNHLKKCFPTWEDQRIIDLLYNGGTHYIPRTVETALRWHADLTK